MVSLYYHTGWPRSFLHYLADNQWKDAELVRTSRYYWHHLELTTYPLRFVLTDGDGKWDNPSQQCANAVGRNYCVSEPGRYAVFKGDLIRIRERGARVLLITDLDGTLLEEHNPEAAAASERFARFWLERHYFNDSKLVYSTGRSIENFQALRNSRIVLLDPDVVVSSVGSDVYVMRSDSGEYEPRDDYMDVFDAKNWDTGVVSQTLDAHFPWLIQPQSQMDFRLKTWRQARVEDLADHERALKSFIKRPSNWPSLDKEIQCRVHISGTGSYRYLDFTPRNGAKRAGVDYCRRLFVFESWETLIAGDSGNDFAMLKGPERGVIPANRQPEMDTWFYKRNRGPKYISQRPYADAIVEALERVETGRFP